MVVDIGNQAKGKALLSVVKEDRVLGGHRKHHTVRQLEEVGKSLGRSVFKEDMGTNMNTEVANKNQIEPGIICNSCLLPSWS